jgi:hypothetical protein
MYCKLFPIAYRPWPLAPLLMKKNLIFSAKEMILKSEYISIRLYGAYLKWALFSNQTL